MKITAGISRSTRLALLLAVMLLEGCTHLFFLPQRAQVFRPEQFGVHAVDVDLVAADGIRLFAWQLPAQARMPPPDASVAQPTVVVGEPPATRGVVCYFHGNAENISTHIANVAWLAPAGYEVLLVDYRGYGASQGKPEFPEVFADLRAGLDWCLARAHALGVPAFALGQSLGAAMLLEVASTAPYRERLSGVVADSGFSGYRRIARDALSHSWLLAPLQYPLSWLVMKDYEPAAAAHRMAPLPLLVMHSRDDRVVPYPHGERNYAAAQSPACFLTTRGDHNAAFRQQENRDALLAFFAAPAAPAIPTLQCKLSP